MTEITREHVNEIIRDLMELLQGLCGSIKPGQVDAEWYVYIQFKNRYLSEAFSDTCSNRNVSEETSLIVYRCRGSWAALQVAVLSDFNRQALENVYERFPDELQKRVLQSMSVQTGVGSSAFFQPAMVPRRPTQTIFPELEEDERIEKMTCYRNQIRRTQSIYEKNLYLLQMSGVLLDEECDSTPTTTTDEVPADVGCRCVLS